MGSGAEAAGVLGLIAGAAGLGVTVMGTGGRTPPLPVADGSAATGSLPVTGVICAGCASLLQPKFAELNTEPKTSRAGRRMEFSISA